MCRLSTLVLLAASAAACGRRASPAPARAVTPAWTDAGASCGDLGCAQFDSPADALNALLPGGVRVVALGEAHAPKDAAVKSAAARFTDALLPVLAGRSSDLLVELMKPPEGCAPATLEVRAAQAPVIAEQAPANQNEYLAMGERARALGIVPDLLRPSCADLDGVVDAGDGAVEESLAMIARLSAAQAARLLDRDLRSPADRDKLVVLYGGMLHNDLAPAADHRAWSYGPALDAKTGGRVVAIDLVVPEFIVDDDAWRALPWTWLYDRRRLGKKTTVFRLADRSFVLVFPETRPLAAGDADSR
jgi:hypothetical protein